MTDQKEVDRDMGNMFAWLFNGRATRETPEEDVDDGDGDDVRPRSPRPPPRPPMPVIDEAGDTESSGSYETGDDDCVEL